MYKEPGNQTIYTNYPEYIAKTHNFNNDLKPCNQFFKSGSCEQGHKFLKAMVCGREYCPECGKKDSAIHQRRKARWFQKLHSLETVGYLVITIPIQARDYFKDKKILSEFRTYIKRKLQRMKYDRGLIRYHWFGDCKLCKGQGCKSCNDTGAGTLWNPHLNILIKQGFMNKSDFTNFTDELKIDVCRWIKNKFGLTGSNLKGNVNFQFSKNPAKINHWLNYVTRSTFRIYNYEIAHILEGFKTSSTFGKFDKCKIESKQDDLISLESGLCPCCGYPVTWQPGIIHRKIILPLPKQLINGGYYRLE